MQRHVGAGDQLQVQVGGGHGRGRARIDDDDTHVAVSGFARFDAAPDDRMAPRGIRAGNQESIAQLDIGIGHRWAVDTERLLVAHHRRGHAQA